MPLFLEGLYPRRIQIKLITGKREEADRPWDVEKCPCVECHCSHDKYHSVEVHAKKYRERNANIITLRWFWGSIRTMIKANATTTIRDAIGEGPVLQCGAED
jgi:hypothetical protein